MKMQWKLSAGCTNLINAWVAYIAAILALVGMLVIFRATTLNMYDRLATRGLALALAEALVILLPYWFLPPKWRKTVLIPVWACGLFMFVNTLYIRMFGDLLPISAHTLSRNAGNLVWQSIPPLFTLRDFIYILLPLLLTIDVAITPTRQTTLKQSLSSGFLMLIVTIAVYLFAQMHYTHRLGEKWSIFIGKRSNESIWKARCDKYQERRADMAYNGLTLYLLRQGYYGLTTDYTPRKLTADELSEIEKFTDRRRSLIVPDSIAIFDANRGKNLLLIIVESLNSDILYRRIGNAEITPNLNALAGAEGSIVIPNIVCQIGTGGSSDAQLIYNTGILPLKDEAVSMTRTSNSYISLIDQLQPSSSLEVIGEESRYWNHDLTTKIYGFDRLVSAYEIPYYKEIMTESASDAAIFALALNEIPRLQSPWFAQVTTLSTHLPYTDYRNIKFPELKKDRSVPRVTRTYYMACRYFDTQLGIFLDKLRSTGALDNTIIAIIADHNTALTPDEIVDGSDFSTSTIPMVIAGSGITRKIDRVVAQADVFPTLLDVSGHGTSATWRGVGVSVFSPASGGAIDIRGKEYGTFADSIARKDASHAWRISSLIHRK